MNPHRLGNMHPQTAEPVHDRPHSAPTLCTPSSRKPAAATPPSRLAWPLVDQSQPCHCHRSSNGAPGCVHSTSEASPAWLCHHHVPHFAQGSRCVGKYEHPDEHSPERSVGSLDPAGRLFGPHVRLNAGHGATARICSTYRPPPLPDMLRRLGVGD